MSEVRYFVTVQWCQKGPRGIFCNSRGQTDSKDRPHTEAEMQEMLDVFWLILNPQSEPLAEDELAEYCCWTPLAEYSNVWGIAAKAEAEARDGD